MSANGERVRKLITEEAAGWFVANRAGLTAKGRDSFAVWLQASPVHVEEYLALSVIADDLPKACENAQYSLDDLLTRARLDEDTSIRPLWKRVIACPADAASHAWRTAAITMAACGLLSLGLLAWWDRRPGEYVAAPDTAAALHFETRHGEQQTHRLADNSVLHLNTDSAVTVRYSKKERFVVLDAGETDFEVSHEPDRPFRVVAGSAEVVAIGTKFDVRLGHHSTVVAVVEGRVAVGPSTSDGRSQKSNLEHSPRFVEVGADQQITVSEGEWPPARSVAVDVHRATAWLHRQIMFDHEPLERVTSEFNRYSSKPIEITTPALRALEISGIFSTDNTAGFIAFLRSLKGVRVEETETRIRVSGD